MFNVNRCREFVNFVVSGLCMLCLLTVAGFSSAADYQIGAGDFLKIGVFDHAELSLETRVSESGSISFPLVGQIHVSGLSTRDVEQLLVDRLRDGGFVHKPQVSVLVAEYMSQKVSVLGQVAKPG